MLCEACAYSAGMYCDACNHNRLLVEQLRHELVDALARVGRAERKIEAFETAANRMLQELRETSQAMESPEVESR